MGIINLVLSFILKDVVIPGMNLLIYLGLTICFFNTDIETRRAMNGVAEGIIDIIYMALSAAMIAFLIIKYKNTMFVQTN